MKAESPASHPGPATASAAATGVTVPSPPVSQASAGSGTRPETRSSPKGRKLPPSSRAQTGLPRAARMAPARARCTAPPSFTAMSIRGRGAIARAIPSASTRVQAVTASARRRGPSASASRAAVSSGVSRVSAVPRATGVAPVSSVPRPQIMPPAPTVLR